MIKKIVIGIVATLFVTIVFFLSNKENNEIEAMDTKIIQKNETKEDVKKDAEDNIFVDIKGEINYPGVYEVTKKDRVKDVIEKSGGLKENADTSYINLSKKVNDEMVIYIFSKEEAKQIQNNDSVIKNSYIYKNNDAIVTYEESNQAQNENSFPVNINTASKEELMTIPGIGDSKADLIIEYRSQTLFETIEDIKNIKGIGDSTYEKLKDYITV